MDTATKDDLTARFRAYLDQQDSASSAEAGLAVAEAPDLFSLLSELAALKNEVKLESRQVKAALDEFRGLFEALEAANSRADQDLTSAAAPSTARWCAPAARSPRSWRAMATITSAVMISTPS